MARRYGVTDTQWEIIKSYLGNTPKKTGRPKKETLTDTGISKDFAAAFYICSHTRTPYKTSKRQ